MKKAATSEPKHARQLAQHERRGVDYRPDCRSVRMRMGDVTMHFERAACQLRWGMVTHGVDEPERTNDESARRAGSASDMEITL